MEMAEEDSESGDEEPQQKKGGLFSGFGFGSSKSAGKKAKASKKSDAYSAQLFLLGLISLRSFNGQAQKQRNRFAMAAAPVDPFVGADDNAQPAADASPGMQQPGMDIMGLMGDGAMGSPVAPVEAAPAPVAEAFGGMSPQTAADPFAGMVAADPGTNTKVGIPEMTPLREWEDKHERELDEANCKEVSDKKERRRVADEAILNFYEERQVGIKAKQGTNRTAQEAVEQEKLDADKPNANPWERVSELIDISARTVEDNGRCTERMRKLLLELGSSSQMAVLA